MPSDVDRAEVRGETADTSRICSCSCATCGGCASGEWVVARLREGGALALDLRTAAEFAAGHVRHAVHLSVPSIMLRRLAAGKLSLPATVPAHHKELRARLADAELFVLYGEPAEPTLRRVLLHRLRADGASVVCLRGEFDEFRRRFPEWCSEAVADRPANHLPLMGLRSLRISGEPASDDRTSSGSSSDCDDSRPARGCRVSRRDFPVEILPNLYLGDSADSEDCEGLARHNIKYVLNVTPDLPNVFESVDGDINYLKIPITDHWSQNLATHFPQAIKFIEEGVSSNCGVLVHCVAGISRSVTVTVAYLMQCHRLSLDDAFTLVRSRKADVAPNFHFMRQLHCFERDLGLDVESRSLSKVLEELSKGCKNEHSHRQELGEIRGPPDSGFDRHTPSSGCMSAQSQVPLPPMCPPLSVGISPDSGIEFDRWGGNQETPQ